MKSRLVVGFSAGVCALAACSRDTSSAPPAAPQVGSVVVAGSDANVLSAITTFVATDADSVRVRYWTADHVSHSTPYTTNVATGRIVVLGLRPSTAYSLAVDANGHGIATSDTLSFTTDALPPYLALATLQSAAPSSGGYILTAIHNGTTWYVVAFDSTGQVGWYHTFAGTAWPTIETKQQVNGDITAIMGGSGGEARLGQGVELSPDGSVVRTFLARAGSYLDVHELQLLTDHAGAYAGAVFFVYTQRHLDLSGSRGPADTVISGHQIIREDAGGTQHVMFDSWDHFVVADNVEASPGQIDFDHPNSITVAPDGDYIVSWRDFDAITKHDATTGAIVWTLASPTSALTSSFTIVGDPLGGFSAQHSARPLANGNLILFDNGTKHIPTASRALEYQLDEAAHTATLVWSFSHNPSIFTAATGSVQRLGNGNTLIGYPFGAQPLVAAEVSAEGVVAWEGTLHTSGPQVPYRFTKVRSLYRYEAP